jgi:hypothetical protein
VLSLLSPNNDSHNQAACATCVQIVNFGLVPMHFRIPFAAGISFGWTVILSVMQGDAPTHYTPAWCQAHSEPTAPLHAQWIPLNITDPLYHLLGLLPTSLTHSLLLCIRSHSNGTLGEYPATFCLCTYRVQLIDIASVGSSGPTHKKKTSGVLHVLGPLPCSWVYSPTQLENTPIYLAKPQLGRITAQPPILRFIVLAPVYAYCN